MQPARVTRSSLEATCHEMASQPVLGTQWRVAEGSPPSPQLPAHSQDEAILGLSCPRGGRSLHMGPSRGLCPGGAGEGPTQPHRETEGCSRVTLRHTLSPEPRTAHSQGQRRGLRETPRPVRSQGSESPVLGLQPWRERVTEQAGPCPHTVKELVTHNCARSRVAKEV